MKGFPTVVGARREVLELFGYCSLKWGNSEPPVLSFGVLGKKPRATGAPHFTSCFMYFFQEPAENESLEFFLEKPLAS